MGDDHSNSENYLNPAGTSDVILEVPIRTQPTPSLEDVPKMPSMSASQFLLQSSDCLNIRDLFYVDPKRLVGKSLAELPITDGDVCLTFFFFFKFHIL